MNERTGKASRRVIWWLVVAGVLLLAYPLTYAPVVKFMGGYEVKSLVRSGKVNYLQGSPYYGNFGLPMYRPVDWLIDNTPLREPLLKWADVWGVRNAFDDAALCR